MQTKVHIFEGYHLVVYIHISYQYKIRLEAIEETTVVKMLLNVHYGQIGVPQYYKLILTLQTR